MIERTCIHGTSRSKLCWHCRDTYAQEDLKYYKAIFDRKGGITFDVAFNLAKRFDRWSELHKSKSIDKYLKELKKTKELQWEINTLKQAYYVVKAFNDLDKRENRKLRFSHYREIANAYLAPERKQGLRAEAENRGGITVKEIRKLIESEANALPEKKTAARTIIYHTEEQFLKDVKAFLDEHTWIEQGTSLTISGKNKR